MSFIDAFIIGALQGLTEFLPISSSGHLVIMQHLLNVNIEGNLVEVAAHIGTLLSVLIFYKKEIINICLTLKTKETQSYVAILFLATLPSILFVLYAKNFILAFFESQKYVGVALFLTGIVLFLSILSKKTSSAINVRKAVLIGLAQAFAIIPGISRSGMTITTALILGIAKKEAARFSFFLAIPAILGATVLTIFDAKFAFESTFILPIALIVVVSFISGYYALKALIKVLESGKLYYFGFYCLIIGLISFLSF